jgi:hypothetical protein
MKTLLLTLSLLLAMVCHAQNPLTLLNSYEGEEMEFCQFGSAITCGDFDGDGLEEFIIGASGWNNYTGKNYFFKLDGSGSKLPYLTVQGDSLYEHYDVSDANLGDINGDGLPDLGIPLWGLGPQMLGFLDIYFGSIDFDTIPDFTITEPLPVLLYGNFMDSLGDVNGDGGNDFAFTETFYPVQNNRILIFFGGSMFDSVPDWSISTEGYIHAAGDVNGDGFNDLLVTYYSGNPRLYFGGNPMDTIPDLIFQTSAAQGHGAGVGDVNADGFADFVMPMYFPDSTTFYDVLYLGGLNVDNIPDFWLRKWNGGYAQSFLGVCSGDFNGDGISDIVETSPYGPYTNAVQIVLGSRNFNPNADAYITGWSEYEFASNFASGDVDGDGRDELLVQARNYPWNDIGTVFLYDGPETWIDYGASGIPQEELQRTPGWFKLNQNFPNPFNATTSINFDIGKPSTVTLQVFDLSGGKIKSLLDHHFMNPGGYNVSWTGKNESGASCASGIYLLELQVDQYRDYKKLILLR